MIKEPRLPPQRDVRTGVARTESWKMVERVRDWCSVSVMFPWGSPTPFPVPEDRTREREHRDTPQVPLGPSLSRSDSGPLPVCPTPDGVQPLGVSASSVSLSAYRRAEGRVGAGRARRTRSSRGPRSRTAPCDVGVRAAE